MNTCECGCGAPLRTDGKPQRFVNGHQNQGRWRKDHVNEWHARARARSIKGPGGCELSHITGCSTKIQVHHLNRDLSDNRPENLMRLCGSHHSLVERGVIDLANPIMPRFIIAGGVRRYEHSYRDWGNR